MAASAGSVLANVVIPVWQKKEFFPAIDERYIRKIHEKHELQTLDGRSIEEVISKKEPFLGRYKNFVRFHTGMASLMYRI